MRVLRIFRYRKKIIFYSLYCFGLLGFIYYVLADRYYESSAKLLIVEQNLDRVSGVGEHDNSGNTMMTHRELVISPVVIEDAIQRLPAQFRVDLQGVPPTKWVQTIAKRLHASNTRKTNFIEVSYRSLHPEAASAVVSAVIDSYLDFVSQNHSGTAGEIKSLLTEQREKLQADLNLRQRELQEFHKQVGHLSISVDDEIVEPMIQRALHLNDALLEAKEKRLNIEATLESVQQGLARGEDINQHLMSIEESVGRQMLLASMGLSPQDMQVLSEQQKKLLEHQQELEAKSADLGPNHPVIQELQQKILTLQSYLRSYHSATDQRMSAIGQAIPTETILNMLRQAAYQAEQQENQLTKAFELARDEAAQHSDKLVQLRMLERDVNRKETLYDSLSDKIATFDISQVQAPIKATVVREPVPSEFPATPQLRLLAAASLVGGTFIGALIVYVQDVLDDRFNSPEELSAQLSVPVLAMVRNLEALPGEGFDTVHTFAMPNSVETEAFRTLRTSLSLGTEVCDRILVSSSEPGDGKTTISANLSVALAQAGKRTLVIDADLRRPGFTALANLKGLPGVADVLASDRPPSETAPPLIKATPVKGLDVLPVGLRRPNPAELLSDKQFVELLAWADSQYDRVIVDCPPVLAVSDAQIVGQLVDGAILVVRPEKNHRRSVIRAVESFHSTGCRVFGVVANGLSNESSGYGYGYGYGYNYEGGYGHEEEELESSTPDFVTPRLAVEFEIPEVNDSPADLTKLQPEESTQAIRPRRAA